MDADLARLLRGVDEVAVHGPVQIAAACRRAGARVVPLTPRSRVVVTADGALRDGVVVNLKDEVDAIAPGAERVIVVRCVGNAPLAPTMDAYLDVTMIPGRDLWLQDLLDEEPRAGIEAIAEYVRGDVQDLLGRRQPE